MEGGRVGWGRLLHREMMPQAPDIVQELTVLAAAASFPFYFQTTQFTVLFLSS